MFKKFIKKRTFLADDFLFEVYTVVPVLMKNHILTSSFLASFVIIYIFVLYVKNSNLQGLIENKTTAILFGIIYFVLILICYQLDIVTKTRYFSYKSNISTTTFYNIILLIFITSLIFISQQNILFNSLVNNIGSFSFLMFMFHTSPLFNIATKIALKFIEHINNYDLGRIVYVLFGAVYYFFLHYFSYYL